jgi:hypothetical protein
LADKYTLRARAVAVVTNGSFFGCEGKTILSVMDWIVYQIIEYTNLDAVPFVVQKKTNLPLLFKNLSTTYGTIIYLDS